MNINYTNFKARRLVFGNVGANDILDICNLTQAQTQELPKLLINADLKATEDVMSLLFGITKAFIGKPGTSRAIINADVIKGAFNATCQDILKELEQARLVIENTSAGVVNCSNSQPLYAEAKILGEGSLLVVLTQRQKELIHSICLEKELMDMQKDLNAAIIHHFVSKNTDYKLSLPLTTESKIIYKGYLQTIPISKPESGQRPVFKGEALCRWVIRYKRFPMPKTVVQETNFQHQAIKDA